MTTALPLCLGLDPGSTSGVALVEPVLDARPRLLVLRVVRAPNDPDRWAEAAFSAMEAVAAARPPGHPLVGWYELTPPLRGWQAFHQITLRRGQLLQAAADAGLPLGGLGQVMPQTWTSRLELVRGKRGEGQHRLAEAERLVEMPPSTLRGLGKGATDGAEAILIAAARARLAIAEACQEPLFTGEGVKTSRRGRQRPRGRAA